MNRMQSALALVLLVLGIDDIFAQNYGQIPAPAQAQPIALVGATVHPVSAAPMSNATIVFENGKITALGENVTVPANAKKIEVTGKHVYPAMIAAHTTLGLIEIGAVRATMDFSETGQINPSVRAEVAVNPDGEMIPVTRANGVALALSVPQGGLISGTSALLMLDGWTWEQMTLKAPVAMHVDWPTMSVRRTRRVTSSEEEQRKQIQENLRIIKEAFAAARAYMIAKNAEAKMGNVHHESDSRWEAMLPVLERKIPVFVTANDAKQIRAALQWAEDENIRVAIVGGKDAWRVASLLQEKNVPVIYGPIHDLPGRVWEAYDTQFAAPKKLYEAGVKFCIANFENSNVRNLPYEAATAAAYGLPREEALKAITLNAAEILGVSDRLGSLQEGKDATLIVTTGDPLEITTQIEREFIQGREIDLGSKHKALYEKYSEKYRRLQHPASGSKAAGTN